MPQTPSAKIHSLMSELLHEGKASTFWETVCYAWQAEDAEATAIATCRHINVARKHLGVFSVFMLNYSELHARTIMKINARNGEIQRVTRGLQLGEGGHLVDDIARDDLRAMVSPTGKPTGQDYELVIHELQRGIEIRDDNEF